jgi:hypothetical protein
MSARLSLVLVCVMTFGLTTGCTQAGREASTPLSPTPISSPPPSPASVTPWYCAVAASGGFNRNNAWGAVCGTHLQGTINTANSTCRQYSSNGSCDDVFWCGPPDLTPRTPWIAFYRTSVFVESYISRGAYGISCGHPTEAAARAEAQSLCSIHGCQFIWSDRAYR